MRSSLAVFLLACAAPPSHVAATLAAPSVTASAPPPKVTMFHGIEHPQFVLADGGRLWLFGPGLTTFKTSTLPIGKTLHVHYAVCDFDQTQRVERGRCRAVTRAELEKVEPALLQSKFWAWAREQMTVVDAPVDPSIAQTYARAHAAHDTPHVPELIVTSESATTLRDEVACVGHDEALPICRPTGKKLRHVEHTAALTFDTNALMPTISEDGYPAMTSIVGSGATWANGRFVIVRSEDEKVALTSALIDAYTHAAERAKTLAMLESSEQDNRDVRIALIVDRVILAWWLKDVAALRRATNALDAELANGEPGALEVQGAVFPILARLHQLRDDPSSSITLPAGLDALR